MRRTGRSATARGVAALAVMATGIVVVATRGTTPVAQASTLLVQSKDADIVTSSGATHAAVTGQQVVAGDVVTTGPHGFAQLLTRGRLVLLSSKGALAVVSGDHQQLRTGTAVVDALHGAGLALDLAGDTVTIPVGSATEAARGVSVRIGALAGPAAVSSTTGRHLAMPPLSQTLINGDALPAVTTPLHLMDSDDEDRVVPRLVADDIAMKTLARGIDTTGRSTAQVIEASWTGLAQPIPDRTRSERVLPVLIADATHGGDMQQRYDDAVAWRAEGGSWGVVLHLLNGQASSVESTLSALQHSTQKPGQVGSITPTVVGDFTGSGTGSHNATQPATTVTSPFPSNPSAPGTPAPGGGATPTPAPTLLGSLVSTVQSVIDGVLNLLPHDSTVSTAPDTKKTGLTSGLTATKSASQTDAGSTTHKASKAPTTTPAATSSNGLLGNLLGGLLGKH
ncbi:MAG TPA: hypothetical protein VHV76_07575 [Mycobacteriales bacterium]|nr:hypothetical protein [Mycobacteriales bacterium]